LLASAGRQGPLAMMPRPGCHPSASNRTESLPNRPEHSWRPIPDRVQLFPASRAKREPAGAPRPGRRAWPGPGRLRPRRKGGRRMPQAAGSEDGRTGRQHAAGGKRQAAGREGGSWRRRLTGAGPAAGSEGGRTGRQQAAGGKRQEARGRMQDAGRQGGSWMGRSCVGAVPLGEAAGVVDVEDAAVAVLLPHGGGDEVHWCWITA
jgi:hypothetical protein